MFCVKCHADENKISIKDQRCPMLCRRLAVRSIAYEKASSLLLLLLKRLSLIMEDAWCSIPRTSHCFAFECPSSRRTCRSATQDSFIVPETGIVKEVLVQGLGIGPICSRADLER
nr:hypothetical protein CFP56_78450 [Quercus suber]